MQIRLLPNTVIVGPAVVGSGNDLVLGNFAFDLNAGLAGDEFTFFDNGGFFSDNIQIVLENLDFSGGEVLTGFQLAASSLSNLSVSTTANSVTFTFDDPGVGPDSGPAISGKFLTAPAAVPLPAGLPLLAASMAAISFLRRRKTT